MFRIVVKKLFNNKWLFLSLLIGMIMTIAMITAIPLYTEGVLQRMLVKDVITSYSIHYTKLYEWQGLIRRCMNQDFSWKHSANEYIELYNRIIQI